MRNHIVAVCSRRAISRAGRHLRVSSQDQLDRAHLEKGLRGGQLAEHSNTTKAPFRGSRGAWTVFPAPSFGQISFVILTPGGGVILMRFKRDTSNVFIPAPQSSHLSGRRRLAMLLLMLLALIAASLTWAAADAQERNCGSVYWK